jgi:3-hydroxy-9,10-secoandrosta-1,3,5(10)-triene-9,17-dione monooxygenase reductase component
MSADRQATCGAHTASAIVPGFCLTENRRPMDVNALDGRAYRDTMGQFCTGVVVVTGCFESQPAGFAAQSFVSVSLDPPLVAICPARTSTSWPKVRASGSFCINILGEHQKPICDLFARSGGDKFATVAWRAGVTGSPVLDGIVAFVDCTLVAEHDAGDHLIAVGRVRDLRTVDAGRAPLLFCRGGYGRFSRLA